MTTSMPFDKVNGRNVRRMVATGKNRVHTISISYYGCLRNGQIVRPSSCCVSQRKLELSILCILSIPGFRPAFLSQRRPLRGGVRYIKGWREDGTKLA